MKRLSADDLVAFLDEKYAQYNRIAFIESDPVSIPHLFSKKEDIEIAGFLTATISWGQRSTILKNARMLMHLMDDAPFSFITGFTNADLKPFRKFVHRTFQPADCLFFLLSLQHLYLHHGGLQPVFSEHLQQHDAHVMQSISNARNIFFEIPHPARTRKHFPDPAAGSAAKRLNMFLRWMVRSDRCGVDFGIWKTISPSQLICPLDVHSGRVARKLGLLSNKQDNAKAAIELTNNLKKLDPHDPVKYDFALFGLGVFEGF